MRRADMDHLELKGLKGGFCCYFLCFPPIMNNSCTRERGATTASFKSHVTKKHPLPVALCGFYEEDFDI